MEIRLVRQITLISLSTIFRIKNRENLVREKKQRNRISRKAAAAFVKTQYLGGNLNGRRKSQDKLPARIPIPMSRFDSVSISLKRVLFASRSEVNAFVGTIRIFDSFVPPTVLPFLILMRLFRSTGKVSHFFQRNRF